MNKLTASLLLAAAVSTTATAVASPYVTTPTQNTNNMTKTVSVASTYVPAPTRNPHYITTTDSTTYTLWFQSKADSRGGGTFAQVPFNMSFNIEKPSYKMGSYVGFNFSFKSLEEKSVFLRAPVVFKIQIKNAKTKKVVWTGNVPAIEPAEFPNWEKMLTLRFEWMQKDAKGRQVPAGKYHAELVGPAVISYSTTKDGEIQKQKLRLDAINRGGFDFVITK